MFYYEGEKFGNEVMFKAEEGEMGLRVKAERKLDKTKIEFLPRSFHLGIKSYAGLENILGKRSEEDFEEDLRNDKQEIVLKKILQKLKEIFKENVDINRIFGIHKKKS